MPGLCNHCGRWMEALPCECRAERAREAALEAQRPMLLLAPKPCDRCKVVFVPKAYGARFCGGKCRTAAWRSRHRVSSAG